jgi:flagellin
VNDEVMLQADQKEIDNALATIDRISEQAQFGQRKLLDGSRGASGTTTGNYLEFVEATLESGDSRENGFDVKISQAASKASASGSAALTDEIVKGGETLTIIENGKMATYTSNADDTKDTLVQNLRSEVNRKGLNVDVVLSDTGLIEVSHKEFGSDYSFQVSSSTAGVLSKEAGQIEVSQRGLDVKGTINGESAVGKGQILTGVKGAKCVDGLSVRFYGEGKDLVMPPACTVADLEVPEGEMPIPKQPLEITEAGVSVGRVFVAQNSMKFQVGANKGQTVGISVKGTNTENLAKGVVNYSGYNSLSDVDVTSFQGAQDALILVDQAINEITSSRGDLGAFQKNTLEANLSNLRIANENLISSESVIRDVDMAKEMAQFTRNQIMTQSATAMLAQANQLPQNVLQLLS